MGGAIEVGGSQGSLCLCEPSAKREHSPVECHWPTLRGTGAAPQRPSLQRQRGRRGRVPNGMTISTAHPPFACSVSSRVLSEWGVEQPLPVPAPSLSLRLGGVAGTGFNVMEPSLKESGGNKYSDWLQGVADNTGIHMYTHTHTHARTHSRTHTLQCPPWTVSLYCLNYAPNCCIV